MVHGGTSSKEAAHSGAVRYGSALHSKAHLRSAAEREFRAFKGKQREERRKRDEASVEEKRKRDEAGAAGKRRMKVRQGSTTDL